jgi:uncharacterized linocin/CFP29 family protein
MGFGSYDESEQGNHDIDTDDLDEVGPKMAAAHDGELNFEYDDASSEDLLEAYEEFKSR